jgi:hypothetical protein
MIRSALRRVVEKGKAAAFSTILDRWEDDLLKLDWLISCGRDWKERTPWWKVQLHRIVPGELFHHAMYRYYQRCTFRPRWNPKPAYGIVGRDTDFQCIDRKMGHPEGVCIMPRMIRTPDGREMLQHHYLREQQELLDLMVDEFNAAGAD